MGAWKYYILLYTDERFNFSEDLVMGPQTETDGIPVCSDFTVAKWFDSPEELLDWVVSNTTLSSTEFCIKGIYYTQSEL